MRKKLLRFLRFAPLALLCATVAYAQTTSTIIGVVTDASTGKPVEGAVVIATSPNLQGEQTAVTSKDGSFRITLLPPGQYKLSVQTAGFKPGERSDIRLGLDKTLRANLAVVPEAVTLEEQVVKTGTQAPVINVGSAESGQVVSKEFVAAIPVGRSFESVAISVPGANADPLGIGFSGGQSLDNAYILDGLNVTSPAMAGNGSNLLTNFVEEVDVKTGSFMPEYGRATGGVVNVVSKSGSNEFHGSVFSNLSPDWLVKSAGTPTGSNGYSIWSVSKPQNGAYSADYGFEVGGPIKKDKLWFYAGFAPQTVKNTYERYIRAVDNASGAYIDTGDVKKYDSTAQTYQWTGKLTYLVNENHNLTLGSTGNFQEQKPYSQDNSTEERRSVWAEFPQYDVNARYNGKFLQKKLLVEAVGGIHYQRSKTKDRSVTIYDASGAPIQTNQYDDPRITYVADTHYWDLTTFEAAPAICSSAGAHCYARNYDTGGILNQDFKETRYAGKVAVSYLGNLFGSHQIKGGVDVEANSFDRFLHYGSYGRYQLWDSLGFALVRGFGTVRGGSTNSTSMSNINFTDQNAAAVAQSNSLFLQDSWQVGETGLTLNFGVRWETQSLKDKNSAQSPKLSINDNIAPRFAIIYDPTRTGRSKISANWGRYYEMIPLDMASRSFGSEVSPQAVFGGAVDYTNPAAPTMPGCPSWRPGPAPFDPRTCGISPTGGGDFGLVDFNGNITNVNQYGGISPVAPDLKGSYIDQFGGAIEYEVVSDLSVGIVYEGRRLGRAIEDMSSNNGATFFIANPGESKPFDYYHTAYAFMSHNDPKQATASDPLTGRSYTAYFPKPRREYDGITFKVTKNFSRNWLAQAAYTYSSLRGNYNGLFTPQNGQTDPNITSQYDLPSLLPNRDGPLEADSPHQVRVYGAYTWTPSQALSITGGGGYRGRSGNPVDYLGSHPIYGANEAFVLPRGLGGRTPFVNQVDLKGQVEYVFKAPYSVKFTVDVFNIFNDQTGVVYDNLWTSNAILPIVNGQCKSKNAAGKADPIAAARADCPDLAYLRTIDGRVPTVNSNWGRVGSSSGIAPANWYLAARSLRLGLQVAF